MRHKFLYYVAITIILFILFLYLSLEHCNNAKFNLMRKEVLFFYNKPFMIHLSPSNNQLNLPQLKAVVVVPVSVLLNRMLVDIQLLVRTACTQCCIQVVSFQF